MRRLWFLTSNEGKLREAQHLFAPLGIDVQSLQVEGEVPEIIEPQCNNLVEVSFAKIKQAREFVPAEEMIMVEDSGLFVDALNGFPGVYSAHALHTIGWNGLLKLLTHLESEDPHQVQRLRKAEFRTSACIWDGKQVIQSIGICPGWITMQASEGEGFGFDPIFAPYDLDESHGALQAGEKGEISTHGVPFGGIELEQKQLFSHRRRALSSLAEKMRMSAEAS